MNKGGLRNVKEFWQYALMRLGIALLVILASVVVSCMFAGIVFGLKWLHDTLNGWTELGLILILGFIITNVSVYMEGRD